MATAGTWVKRGVLGALALVLALLLAVIGYLLVKKAPQTASGWVAKAVCSGTWVAGRDPDKVFDEDVVGANVAFRAVSYDVDESTHTVTARMLGMFKRTATLQRERGCVLDLPPDPEAKPVVPTTNTSVAWPTGDKPLDRAAWPAGVDATALDAVVEKAFVGAGDPAAANARGVAVAQDGKLLVLREAPGFEGGTPLHGWSMTKTVAGMLAYKVFTEKGVSLDTKVVDAFPAGREPSWVADWRSDDRAKITIRHLFGMVDGLDNVEGFTPFDDTMAMLNVEPDMAAFAAKAPAKHEPGTSFNYTSQTANILAAITRAQFATDQEYWAYPYQALFDPIGATSATLETDASGTWVGSSYLWADLADWVRLGQLGLQDGAWNGTQVLPNGWLELASTQAMPTGEGAGYGAQVWLPGDPVGGECRNLPGFPTDTVAMEGLWGQGVAIVPSKKAVVVRLGWTFDIEKFDYCTFWNETLKTLPTP
jgi:CubicO group peptidase (beta-lactamase class C family)